MKPRGGGGGDRAVRKGPWTAEEDEVLRQHVREHGPREWSSIRSKGLLPRTGKSCRLRWVNKLRPNLKTGCKFSSEEERVVIDLQAQFGNKWARIATYLPGRTDNDVKNFWSTRQKRLARILRAPLPRRRPAVAKQNGGRASSAPSHDLPSPKDGACFDMTPFQAATHDDIGQSSQEPCIENQCAGAPFPGSLDPESILPSSMGMAVECGGSYSAATVAHMSYLYSGDAAPMVDPAGLAGVASLGDDVAYLQERKPVVQPPQFFGLEEDVFGHVGPARRGMPDVLFDDLPPEMFDFFEQPPPSPSPLPPAPSRQL